MPVIRAINRQIKEDFEPYWSFGASLRLEGAIGAAIDKRQLADMRGDAILYITDKSDISRALGYHDANFRGIPCGFVFMDICLELKESWTVTLSHEALELLGDAQGNLLVQGPHPADPSHTVFHWFEMCDAVQAQSYVIDGIEVCNFVLPMYFTRNDEEGARNDFLARKTNGKTLASFGVSQGGYVGFFNPKSGKVETYFAPNDVKAQERIEIKQKAKVGRGYVRKHGK